MGHQNKDIRKAIEYAEGKGWTYVEGARKSHLKGVLVCPTGSPQCRISVYGTPRSPTTTAKNIRKSVDKCPHGK